MTTQPPTQPPGESDTAAAPTCYRHPGRETYVRCQRCDRPICPDCMRDASVGFQCPECVAQGNKTVRQARSVFGGSVIAKPYVTWTLLGVNVVMFLAQLATDGRLTEELVMWPLGVAANSEYYRLVTSAFLHRDYLHIGLNMWALFMVGPYLEQAFGHARFLALYLLSALGGSVLGYWIDPANGASLGASGAIFGLFGAMFVVGRRLGLNLRPIIVLLVINLVITFMPGLHISWTAHVGGLVTGMAVSAILAYGPKAGRTLFQSMLLVGALAILVGLVITRTAVLLPLIG
ncbi:membrane associated rhomboid family serine protease [Streptosporangium album]|uniref:Membrane associated rhomboid family serine protease n=1 Tax=Streptosporangium album TaxID=47479 RepID=A0A7W7RW04_9ACTN|nr:rhomboid family intramembrane serine protease [Streptosporangium album]MBB4938396.1 membrane associated rhomboid family serine protease [Streptosporangium album]